MRGGVNQRLGRHGDEVVVHLRQRRQKLGGGAGFVREEEVDHQGDIADRQRLGGGQEAVAIQQVAGHFGGWGRRQLQPLDGEGQAGVEGGIHVVGPLEGEGQAVAEGHAREVIEHDGLAGGLQGGDRLHDGWNFAFGAQRGEPAAVIGELLLADDDRLGSFGGNLDQRIALERLARAFPEALPVRDRNDAVLVQQAGEPGDGDGAEAGQSQADHGRRILADHPGEGVRIAVAHGQDVAGRHEDEVLSGVGKGEGVGRLDREVDDHALVEVVDALDDAEPPGLVQAEGARRAALEEAEAP